MDVIFKGESFYTSNFECAITLMLLHLYKPQFHNYDISFGYGIFVLNSRIYGEVYFEEMFKRGKSKQLLGDRFLPHLIRLTRKTQSTHLAVTPSHS